MKKPAEKKGVDLNCTLAILWNETEKQFCIMPFKMFISHTLTVFTKADTCHCLLLAIAKDKETAMRLVIALEQRRGLSFNPLTRTWTPEEIVTQTA